MSVNIYATDMLLVTIITLSLIKYATLECIIDNRTPNNDFEIELHKDLLCNYKMFEPPDKRLTQIDVRVVLKYFNFDDKEELFTIDTWMYMIWNDPRLKWNPEDYDGIDRINMRSMHIWTPQPFLYHKEDFYEYESLYYPVRCTIISTGNVTCIPRATHTVLCKTTLDNWPFDAHNCTLKFSIREGVKDNMTFVSMTRGEYIYGSYNTTGWNIVDFKIMDNLTGNIKLSLTFITERQALGIAAVVITPSITLAALTVSSLFLDVKDNIRLALATFSLLSSFQLLDIISEILPHQGSDSPTILLFIRSSIVISTFSICLCLILRSLRGRGRQPYRWVTSFNNYVSKSRLNFLLLLQYQTLSELSSDETEKLEGWFVFTYIINNVYTITTLVVYLILFIVYIPRPQPLK
ncbi:neuronal acetylcholine receptor subunit beta-2-like [Vanessa cardui]|uniref:neuronal acetylcholine receptor subunit beta-2-like n=1 Tax=Vanessa cardui TaxID=171605 RepID=UPI001F13A667|nr:neuronal acetylcholine receptor subunit beta-2-like [Vanessa cardui]